MTTRLNWPEILAAYPHLKGLSEGEQVNVNHVGCPAGADKRKRLYVRNKDGRLLGFCHNCQSKGGHGSGERRHIRKRSAVPATRYLSVPKDTTYKWTEFHAAARAWLYKYINPVECLLHKIGWSEEEGRVILPCYNSKGKLTAYQTRRVLQFDRGPKYLTCKAFGVKHPMFMALTQGNSQTVVLCEDALSAVVVSRVANAVALMGVHLSDDNLYELTGLGFNKFVIALDDDKAEVKAQQRRIAKRLSQFGEVVVLTGHTTDPKEWDEAQLRSIPL